MERLKQQTQFLIEIDKVKGEIKNDSLILTNERGETLIFNKK